MTSSDFLTLIEGLKTGKSPGPDGYTPLFYKTFAHQLAPIMTRTFEEVDEHYPLSPQILKAQIVVLPKPEKDHSQRY